MSQNVEIVDLGFSVADAEDITLGFKFQNAEYELSDIERFDSCHIVHDSEWLKEHLKQGEAWKDESWFHYKLNFNAVGIVEVFCSKVVKT